MPGYRKKCKSQRPCNLAQYFYKVESMFSRTLILRLEAAFWLSIVVGFIAYATHGKREGLGVLCGVGFFFFVLVMYRVVDFIEQRIHARKVRISE